MYWICQAQYLWGYVGLSVLALLGPVFIPFILFPQTDWLFWGWVKGLAQCAVHMIVSAADFHVRGGLDGASLESSSRC